VKGCLISRLLDHECRWSMKGRMRGTGGRKGEIVWVIQIVRWIMFCVCEREAKREESDDRFKNERERQENVKGTGWDEDREEALCPYEFLFFLQAGRAG
jgi:hypothetical protein